MRTTIAILALIAGVFLDAPALAGTPSCAPVSPPLRGAAEHLNHGRFQNVAVYSPPAAPKSFVLLLTDDGPSDRGPSGDGRSAVAGSNVAAAALIRELVRHGAMVAGIDVTKLIANFEADGADCIFADGDLENLSHFLQAYYHLPTYLTPFLIGNGSGASLAYATLVQSPADTFGGALTLGFCPVLNLHKPLCKGSGIEFTRRPGARGIEFSPAKKLLNPWVVLEGELTHACAANAAGGFDVEGLHRPDPQAQRSSCCRTSDMNMRRRPPGCRNSSPHSTPW